LSADDLARVNDKKLGLVGDPRVYQMDNAVAVVDARAANALKEQERISVSNLDEKRVIKESSPT
jgi:hypothetical protein